jgi:hypothetical protein
METRRNSFTLKSAGQAMLVVVEIAVAEMSVRYLDQTITSGPSLPGISLDRGRFRSTLTLRPRFDVAVDVVGSKADLDRDVPTEAGAPVEL